MTQALYNRSNKESVLGHAKKLKEKTLRECCAPHILKHSYSGKGNFGQLLERYYFHYKPNSEKEPDFKEIGLELKTSPLKEIKKSKYLCKERLVLNIINYFDIPKEDFYRSTFWKKNASLLLVFYLYQSNIDILDAIIKLVDIWEFPQKDLHIIKYDWETIKKKIKEGKAHELSEGDTFYLGACTKGSKGGNKRKQPFNIQLAKQRAFSLKQGYLNHIIATLGKDHDEDFGKLIKPGTSFKRSNLDTIVLKMFQPYIGLSIDRIIQKTGSEFNVKSKNFYSSLTNSILGIELDKKIEEFEKADIIVKTVRLNEFDMPKEDISFPAFRYVELINETWDTSTFKGILEHKFLFIFLKVKNDSLYLDKVKFWNMPYTDIMQAKKVWSKTRTVIKKGDIVKYVNNKIRHTNFPNTNFNTVAHVRPHAQNANDSFPLPTIDKVTRRKVYTKHSFWLNKKYIHDHIYL